MIAELMTIILIQQEFIQGMEELIEILEEDQESMETFIQLLSYDT